MTASNSAVSPNLPISGTPISPFGGLDGANQEIGVPRIPASLLRLSSTPMKSAMQDAILDAILPHKLVRLVLDSVLVVDDAEVLDSQLLELAGDGHTLFEEAHRFRVVFELVI